MTGHTKQRFAAGARTVARFFSAVLNTDFCPWANRFVYWLKEPVGWFALATLVCVVIGYAFNPIGWTIGAALATIMVVGMVWPAIAVRVVECGLIPVSSRVHEDSPTRMIVSVQNHVPIPIWGLTIEGYWADDHIDAPPMVGLASVPASCTADFPITVTPRLRGRYPVRKPEIACSFPFGLWTARRPLRNVEPLLVWPKLYRVDGECSVVGRHRADHGEGSRGGTSGDFVGVRSFRRGDSARHVHWVASARTDSLIVTERGAPESASVEVCVDVSAPMSDNARESLARRIRAAASLLESLLKSSATVRLQVGQQSISLPSGSRGRLRMLDVLAEVPLDGTDQSPLPCPVSRGKSASSRILVSGGSNGSVEVTIHDPIGRSRAGGTTRMTSINDDQDLMPWLFDVWKEDHRVTAVI